MTDLTMGEMETCSWCSTEVPDRVLKETIDGARICPVCWTEYKACSDCGGRER